MSGTHSTVIRVRIIVGISNAMPSTIILSYDVVQAARTSVRERVLNQVSREELTDKLTRLEKQAGGPDIPQYYLMFALHWRSRND